MHIYNVDRSYYVATQKGDKFTQLMIKYLFSHPDASTGYYPVDFNPSESQESLICNFLISEAKKLTHFLYSFEFFTNTPVGRHCQFSPRLCMCNGTLFTNDVFFHITCITLSTVFFIFLAPSTRLEF